MCGIVGLVSNEGNTDWNKRKKWLTQALVIDTLRGEDSTGLYAFNAEHKHDILLKDTVHGFNFVQLNKVKALLSDVDKYQVFIGHNRAATKGRVDLDNAHPYREEHIRLVHNGTLTNTKGLPNRSTDSASICAALSETKDVAAVLESLQGAYALVWTDTITGRINFAKNDERPLWFATANGGKCLLYASESWMIGKLAIRNDIKLDSSREGHDLFPFHSGEWVSLNPMVKDYRKNLIVKEFTPYKPKPYVPAANNKNISTIEYDFLKEHSLKVDQKIDFVIDKFTPYANGKFGTIYGTYYGKTVTPVCNVVAYNEEDPGDLWMAEGKVSGVSTNWVSGTCEKYVRIDNLVLYENDELENEEASSEVTVREEKNLVLVSPTGGNLVLGPKKLISYDEFCNLVKDGCANCGKVIHSNEDMHIKWTMDREPVCPVCKTIPELHGALLH